MSGGTVCHNSGRARGGIDAPYDNGTAKITGGEVLDNISRAGNDNADVLGESGAMQISGGTFTQDVSEWLAPNNALVYDEATKTYTTSKQVWEIHLTDSEGNAHWLSPLRSDSANAALEIAKIWYESLQGTYSATLKVANDVVIDETIVLNFPITVDFGTYTLTVDGLKSTPAFRVLSDATFVGGTIDATAGESSYAIIVGNGTTEGKVTVNGGTYKGRVTAISVTRGDLVINDGIFEATEYEGAHDFTINCIDANYNSGDATVAINGGALS